MTVAFARLLAMTLTSAQDPTARPFGPGEELVFQIKTLGLRSGTAQFDIGEAEPVQGTPAWPIVLTARSEGLTDTIFPVRDKFISFWDPTTLLPVQAELIANEGRKKRTMSIVFHRTAPAHAVVRVHEEGKDPVGLDDPMPATAQDFQAAVYWLRTRPLNVGDREEIPIVAGKRQWMMVANVIKAQPLEVPVGHFDAVQVVVTTSFAGKLQSKGNTLGYFSADARHLPLRFEADLTLGKMVAELVRFSSGL